jgi:hypothetical protein
MGISGSGMALALSVPLASLLVLLITRLVRASI